MRGMLVYVCMLLMLLYCFDYQQSLRTVTAAAAAASEAEEAPTAAPTMCIPSTQLDITILHYTFT